MNVGFYVETDSLYPSHIETSYGDGTKDTVIVPGGSRDISFAHRYNLPGKYTAKHVVLIGGARVDSTSYSVTHHPCNMTANLYLDKNNNCIFDADELRLSYSTTEIEVDSDGVMLDTIIAFDKLNYDASTSGAIYSFKVLNSDYMIKCPDSGIISGVSSGNSVVNLTDFGFNCVRIAFDVKANIVKPHPAGHDYGVTAILSASSCVPDSGIFSMTLDPRYTNITTVEPAGGTISGTTVTWHYGSLTKGRPLLFYLVGYVASKPVAEGIAIKTIACAVPLSGESDTLNNTTISIDTVHGSYDPNEKTVQPSGDVAAGTNLTYTISFENTGNAPAENIHIMDTLSPNVDEKSLQIISSSYPPNVMLFKQNGYNILKFDFPGIHLLDSSHHGQCDGYVMYSVNARKSLHTGTKIDNRAGIYFDANAVVMTNIAENTIAPLTVQSLNYAANLCVYPNPVADILTIKTDKAYDKLTIINSMGQTVMQQTLQAKETHLNVKGLVPGMYYIMLKNADGLKVEKIEKL